MFIIFYDVPTSYRKIPEISPSKYKPPKPVTQKNPPLNRPSKYSPPPPPGGGLYLEIALKYKVKQSKIGKFPSNYDALKRKFPSVDKPLRIYAPPKIGPSKRAFENPGLIFGILRYFLLSSPRVFTIWKKISEIPDGR